MSRFPVGSVLQDTDDRNNDADDCYGASSPVSFTTI